jgi:hypothetical protein
MLNINKIINGMNKEAWVNDILDEIAIEAMNTLSQEDKEKYKIKNSSYLTEGEGYLFHVNMKGIVFTFDELEVAIIKAGYPLHNVNRQQVKFVIEQIIELGFLKK